MPKAKSVEVYEYVCKEVLVHGKTGQKRICGKVIRSFYPVQFGFWKNEHLAKHMSKKEDITTSEALKRLREEKAPSE